jgi:hypothetical protein
MPRRTVVLGTTLLLVLLTTWAAAVGPHDVLRGDGPDRVHDELTDQPPEDRPPAPDEVEPQDLSERGSSVAGSVLKAVVELGFAALLLWALLTLARGRRLLHRRRRDRQRPEPEEEVDFEVLDPQRVGDALVADATAHRALLLDGTPRNGIVACWHRFEVQASSIGLAREPWETSSEFTLRLLESVDADPAAVRDLAELYREARYSDHEVLESARQRALGALDTVHDGLRRRARAVIGDAR